MSPLDSTYNSRILVPISKVKSGLVTLQYYGLQDCASLSLELQSKFQMPQQTHFLRYQQHSLAGLKLNSTSEVTDIFRSMEEIMVQTT